MVARGLCGAVQRPACLKAPELEVGDRLADLVGRVHDERTVVDDGFSQWAGREKKEARGLAAGTGGDLTAVVQHCQVIRANLALGELDLPFENIGERIVARANRNADFAAGRQADVEKNG